MTRIVVLGPQRRPTLDTVVASLGSSIDSGGPIATVTAGWQEREPDDVELDGLLGGRSANLRLHARWLDALDRDPEYAAAELAHRSELDDLQELYLLQLDGALQALAEIARHGGPARTRAIAHSDAETVVRLVDERHLARVQELSADFAETWRPGERAAVAEHRDAVRHVLGKVSALVVAGGHVGVLLHVLRLFDVAAQVPGTVVAWSAGAMALTDRVLLFHDKAPHGPAHPEFADTGLRLLPGCVLLPHARRRLRTDDPHRLAVLASRAAPAPCVVLDDGVRIDVLTGGGLPEGTKVIGSDGRITA
ncbi:hypothetical protein [Pseudonocardia sp. TRM90224]|uniref:hypothetical protein n=1 Tax=Pseudonocardia sp. TRM90224 TaxID=2812678 RepID=UPI001E417AAB|nr:hypothetical protein [Pseudonocardia sp. TRM90224]